MLNHPGLILDQMNARHEELVAEASQRKLLKSARQWRKATRMEAKEREKAIRVADALVTTAPVAPAAAAALAGTLATCGRHAAGSAR
jgi:regulator of sirC expression with transglutaminase-like and TPR domain